MIIGIGIDIVANSRIRKNTGNMRFMRRIFTDTEIAYFRKKVNMHQSIAASFAAKEAFFKALGTGIISAGLAIRDIGIAREKGGRPYITMSPKVRAYIATTYKTRSPAVYLSISHEKEYSVAVAVIETSDKRQ
ncbi:MAG: holo-ACP synthase [Spirochaetes bacterium]|nr:holo-ACP synthase [Spirochaetota bacterium]